MNANRLIKLTDNGETVRDKMALVQQLLVNFYEEKFPAEDVRQGMDNARIVIDAFKVAESRL